MPRRALLRPASPGLLALALALSLPRAGAAQQPPPATEPIQQVVPDSPAPDSLAPEAGTSPSGAFLRAALLPGWGHSSIGSYTRGGFYFAAEITTAWGLLRTKRRLAESRDRAAFREEVLRAELAQQGVTDPGEIDAALENDERLQDLSDLVASREDQQEDWAALGIFLLFLSGADAFVSAHLADFPTPIDIDAAPLPDGRLELRVSLGLPNRAR